MYNVTLRRVRATVDVVGKQWVLHNLSLFVVLVIWHAMRMRHIVVCGLPRSEILSTLSRKNGTIFEKTVTEHKMCVLKLPHLLLLSEIFLILRINERDMLTH